MSDPLQRFRDAAELRAFNGVTRRLRPRTAGGDGLIDLASNDYLGLSRDPRVVSAAASAALVWGAGSTGSRLVTGTTMLHSELEEAIAGFLRAPDALVFSSGYLANLAVVGALGGPGVLVVSDQSNHASLIDACRLSRSRLVVVAAPGRGRGRAGAVAARGAARDRRHGRRVQRRRRPRAAARAARRHPPVQRAAGGRRGAQPGRGRRRRPGCHRRDGARAGAPTSSAP